MRAGGSAPRVYVQDVVARDGLQIEPKSISAEDKVSLVDGLSRTGLDKIEVSSFISPRAAPNLRDASEVFARITRYPTVTYAALVPNLRGATDAIAAKVDEINFVVSASESHNLANMRMPTAQSFSELKKVSAVATVAGISVNFTVATAFGCPFEGDQAPDRVFSMVETALSWGIAGVTLADTTGMAYPSQVAHMVEQFQQRLPNVSLTLHFHNTRGLGLANVLASYQSGAFRFDGALGGLGGCPFAPGATGNVCTEDLVHMFDLMDIDTGVDLAALLDLSSGLSSLVGHETPGQVAKAGRRLDLHPLPKEVAERLA